MFNIDCIFEQIYFEPDTLNKGSLVILIGPPGSGKTTLANELHDKYGFYKISPDDIREELFGDVEDQSNNKDVFAKVYSRLTHALQNQERVVYDATNCQKFYRKKIIDICKPYAKTIVGVVMNVTLHDCFDRNNSRTRKVPTDVIEEMHFCLQIKPPCLSEGYDILVRTQ